MGIGAETVRLLGEPLRARGRKPRGRSDAAGLSRYRVALAKHEVSLIDADAAPALDALRRGDTDLALVFNYNVAQLIDPSEADLTEILVEPIYAVLPAAHRLGAATEPIQLSELADESWIQCYTASCGLLLDRAARSAGFTPSVAFQTNDYQATLALIATGLGVALLPAISLLNPAHDIRIRQISSPRLSRQIAGATAPGRDQPPAVKPCSRRCTTPPRPTWTTSCSRRSHRHVDTRPLVIPRSLHSEGMIRRNPADAVPAAVGVHVDALVDAAV
jgi:hypothetical protein